MFFFLGALIPTYLISRLFFFLLKKWDSGWQKVLFANCASLVLASLLGGMGMANDGAFAPINAFALYLLPQAFWLVFDLYKINKKKVAI